MREFTPRIPESGKTAITRRREFLTEFESPHNVTRSSCQS